MKRRLLCTDLDGTLIPNDELLESPSAKEMFRRFVARLDVTLVFVTGRHRQLIEKAIQQYDLPQPAFAIADVGTTIYEVARDGWMHCRKWKKHLAENWPAARTRQLKIQLEELSTLRLQEPDKQSRFKISYYTRGDINDRLVDELLADVKQRIVQCDLDANLVWSIDPERKLGMLDILPRRANKLTAILYLMDHLGFSVQDVIFAGDSGNDLDVFRSSIPSIVVGNATAAIKQMAQDASPPDLYIATGCQEGLDGNYSAGVLEGVCHFWPDVREWIKHQ